MRFKYDPNKSEQVKKNPKRGIDFEEAQEIFTHYYHESQKNDDPAQFRAIGWVKGQLFSLIYEVREDVEGEYYHLVTLWKSSSEERKLYEEEYY
jgi:uncharacterized DUF497 family protein